MRSDRIEIESRQSSGVIHALASQTKRPLEEVSRVYESQVKVLEGQARVTIYLHILAARRAREILSAKS